MKFFGGIDFIENLFQDKKQKEKVHIFSRNFAICSDRPIAFPWNNAVRNREMIVKRKATKPPL